MAKKIEVEIRVKGEAKNKITVFTGLLQDLNYVQLRIAIRAITDRELLMLSNITHQLLCEKYVRLTE